MFTKKFAVLVASLVFAISMFVVAPISAGSADGCDTIASLSNGLTSSRGGILEFTGLYLWQAGETISWDLSAGPGGNVAVYVFIGDGTGTIVDNSGGKGATFSANGSHTFSGSGEFSVVIRAKDVSPYSPVVSAVVGCSSPAGTVVGEVSNVVMPPDDRINWQNGDLGAVAYSTDDMGQNPELHVYCWDEENEASWLGFAITQDTIANMDATGEKQLIAEVNVGTCHAEFWMLEDGQFQFNVYGDNGKIYEMLDWDLNFRDAEAHYFDPNE